MFFSPVKQSAVLFLVGAILVPALYSRPMGQGSASPQAPVAEASPGQGPSDPAELAAFIDGLLTGQMRAFHIAGAAFSLVKDGTIMMAKGYGFADVARRKPVLADETLFRCASISKLFTWTAVMQLVEQGKLDLKADINTYLQAFKIPETFPQPITLEHLMSHSAGFEDLAIGIGSLRPERLVPLEEFLRRHQPRRIYPPGRLAAYSNYSTCLAGYIVAKVSGLPFETYVEENILKPLGMTHSSFRQPLPPDLAAQVSEGYRYLKGVFQPEGFEYINVGPAGALSATAPDIARFMIAHLQNGLYQGRRILGEETARLMHTRHFSNDPRVTGNAHGFWERRLNDLTWISHGGDTFLFHSYLMLCPEKNLGFFVAYNTVTGVGDAREELVQAILDRYLPVPPPADSAPDPDFQSQAKKLAGTYGLSRTAVSNYEKVQTLALNVRVTATPQGTLLTRWPAGMGVRQWRQVEPLVFREVGGQDLLVFKSDTKGRITQAYINSLPLLALIRLPWYQSPTLHLAFVAAAILLFLSTLLWPLRAVFRIACRSPRPELRTHGIARLPAVIMSLLFLGYLAGLGKVLSRPEQLMGGLPTIVKSLVVLALGAGVFVVLAGVGTYRAWKFKYWTLCGRAYYTLVVLAGLAFLAFLWYWKLIGVAP